MQGCRTVKNLGVPVGIGGHNLPSSGCNRANWSAKYWGCQWHFWHPWFRHNCIMDVLYYKSVRTYYAHPTGLSPPRFLTFRRPCIRVERRRRPRSWPWSVTRNDYECSVNKRFLLLDELVDVVVAEILSIDEITYVLLRTYIQGAVHKWRPHLFSREGSKLYIPSTINTWKKLFSTAIWADK